MTLISTKFLLLMCKTNEKNNYVDMSSVFMLQIQLISSAD